LGKTLEIRWHPFQLNPEMPVEGLDRRLYRTAKFGSWEQSQRLDAQVSAAGTEVGIKFRHDLMKRTPTTAREFGVTAISRLEDLDGAALANEVKTAERMAASAGIRGVPQITFQGTVVAHGAQKEKLLADSILRILGTAGRCENGVCAV
jgi:predicted DsbA family dithiol-disulfide isomerase